MDIKMDIKQKIAMILDKDDNISKASELDADDFRETMKELSGEKLDFLRTATKLFKVKTITYREVEL